jgi:hypothetical protein
MEQFLDYRMVEDRSVVERAHEVLELAKELENYSKESPCVNEESVMPSRAKKRQQEVHALLSELHCNVDENHILPKTCILLLLKVTQEDFPLGYVKDAKGYIEETKTPAQDEDGYAHKAEGYVTETPTSCPSLYHLEKR